MTLPNVQSTFCSSQSRQAGEPLYGTASRYDVFILVEWNTPFTPQAAADFVAHTFPGDQRARWDDLLKSLPKPRLQLIRQRTISTDADGLTVFVALPRESNPALYEFRLESYTQILDLPFSAMLTGDLEVRHALREQPLYIICTHGQHDPCCARYGLPVYKAALEHAGTAQVWQSSHLGGHRFAATLVALPGGITYGRVTPDDIPAILDENAAGRLHLGAYRGRACYEAIEQIGEYFLRIASGDSSLGAFRVLGVEQTGPAAWAIRFESLVDHAIHALTITQEPSHTANPNSCDSEERLIRMLSTLARYEVIPAAE